MENLKQKDVKGWGLHVVIGGRPTYKNGVREDGWRVESGSLLNCISKDIMGSSPIFPVEIIVI